MSKVLPVDRLGRVVLENYFGEHIGTFQSLQCEKHGDTLHFTDQTGSDHCLVCMKGKVAEPTTNRQLTAK